MMTDDQLSGRLYILLKNYKDEKRIVDNNLKDEIIHHTEGFLNLFGYDTMPEDFIDIQLRHQVVNITLNKKYVEDGMIVI